MAQHSYVCVVIYGKVRQKLIVLLSFLNATFNSIPSRVKNLLFIPI